MILTMNTTNVNLFEREAGEPLGSGVDFWQELVTAEVEVAA